MIPFHSFLRSVLIAILISLAFSTYAQTSQNEKTAIRFHVLAGTNVMQPLEFIGTDDVSGNISKLGYSLGVGLLYELNERISLSARLMWFESRHRYDLNIQFDENSYFYQAYGISEYVYPEPGLPSESDINRGGELGIAVNYNLLKGNHVFGPSAGINVISLPSFEYSSSFSFYDERFGNYEIYESRISESQTLYHVGLDLGLHYRYENQKGNAFTADLRAHLYRNHDIEEAFWIINGQSPDPTIANSGPIKYSYNRFSLSLGYAF